MNSVELIGNLTRDPELRYTSDNKPVANFTIAINRQNEGTDFIDITVWNKQAENVKKYLTKGRKVGVVGSIRTGTYEKDGNKYKTFNILASNVYFLSSNQDATKSDIKEQDAKIEEDAPKSDLDDEVFANFGESIEIDDDGIAF